MPSEDGVATGSTGDARGLDGPPGRTGRGWLDGDVSAQSRRSDHSTLERAMQDDPMLHDPMLDDVVRRRFRADHGSETSEPIERIASLLRHERPLWSDARIDAFAERLAIDLIGMGSVQALLSDPNVTDVLVNGPGEVWVERFGVLERSGIVLTRSDIDRAIERLVGPLGLHADRSHPVVDARLVDGTRVTVVLPPLAVDGPLVAVRRHSVRALSLDELAPPVLASALRDRLAARRNLVVFGATGSGKTTLLRALACELDADERIVTVEDVAELRLPGRGTVRLESRVGRADGVGRVGFRDLVRVALRLRPDRIVVGEVRGAEAADMVWALSTGHDGSMSTVHAASPRDALRRLTSFAITGADGAHPDVVAEQVHAAVHVLVGVRRCSDGRRQVVSVDDVDADDGRLQPVGAAGTAGQEPATGQGAMATAPTSGPRQTPSTGSIESDRASGPGAPTRAAST
ncbi:MAG TPA: ATPase, T2SS/T4P/T4SS family [Microthrixaceae bacterium]|nr:ATPase, T2SS/T4P/T4SS family [Microthrixaceae bacterium]